MKWQFLGPQDLVETGLPRAHTYRLNVWRSPVPGGWLVAALNSRSTAPQPVISFYPDPDHLWTGAHDASSDMLLRPAAGAAATSQPEELVRAASRPARKRIGS
ncbi:MAG: hypothetical protein KGJ62_06180 [Armatimonadetes bacterium]|nr:hypothetical protein [Armatimonadota bacterium]MDE2205898.1 hypothetical protein [Armatimonadota bacterium]